MWDEYAKSIDFNPRSREGSDFGLNSYALPGKYFNPRSREGSDISDHRILLLAYNFNPRSREGSDR